MVPKPSTLQPYSLTHSHGTSTPRSHSRSCSWCQSCSCSHSHLSTAEKIHAATIVPIYHHFISLANLSNFLSRSEITLMEQSKEKNTTWLLVPQFRDWDQKGQVPDYSFDFSKIREMRKQNNTNISRASLGNEEKLMASSTTSNTSTIHSDDHQHPYYHQTNSPTIRSLSFLFY
ncbi:hypothetical protein JHK82_039372 [Glycine max]|uniref:RIN4 pathogenic type III effector avirulence factor Avr cleavage site domain-containing protein n=2 Tax=Glycine max TaxID=3847 RepID=K7M5Z8_SOYBN|nr:hypothetical protein JHK82_039372 [Glycine max]KAG5121435.1 hypothetical protein JHK84_039775 [Glycine max]